MPRRSLPQRQFFVYMLASRSRVLYIGATRDLPRRVHQHRLGLVPGFTKEYQVNRLVHFEEMPGARCAFKRARQIKGWTRAKKIRLIESVNARWLDLSREWFPSDKWLVSTSYSTSSIDLGQSCLSSRDMARSARRRPPVWQRAQ